MVSSCIGKAANNVSIFTPSTQAAANRPVPGDRFAAPMEEVLFQVPITET